MEDATLGGIEFVNSTYYCAVNPVPLANLAAHLEMGATNVCILKLDALIT